MGIIAVVFNPIEPVHLNKGLWQGGGNMADNLSNLPSIYSDVKKSVVAIVSKVSSQPHFPDIIGTGFITREDGLVFTCDHVINAIEKLPRRKNAPKEEWPAEVMMFHFDPDKGTVFVPMEIKGVIQIALFKPSGYYYGEDLPDLGIIRVDFKGLPALQISPEFNFSEGDLVAMSGFPMGIGTLLAPGWLHQLSPTLQTGVISAVLPHPCKHPHGILMDVMCKGGSSGSPVFDVTTGKVIAMVYGVLKEKKVMSGQGMMLYENSTSLSLAITCNFIKRMLENIDGIPELKEEKIEDLKDFYPYIQEKIEKGDFELSPPKEPMLKDKTNVEE